MLTEEQIKTIKEQLIAHVEKGFPADKKDYAINQIKGMNAEQLEEFLKQNNLSVDRQGQADSVGQCIFCSIVVGDIPSYKVAENSDAIAVLEINPLSRGHVMIIPKKHVDSSDKMPKSVLALAGEISKKIKSLLKPEDVNVKSSNLFGHEIVNVLPLYKEDLASGKKSERYKASEEELLSLQKLFSESEKPKEISKKSEVKKPKKKEKMILPRRIP